MAAGRMPDEAAERRIADAALMLLDACHAVGPGAAARESMTATAVQAIFFAEDLPVGAQAAQRIGPVDEADSLARFVGLGLGVGSCLGALNITPGAGEQCRSAYLRGLKRGLEQRAELIRRMGRDAG